jgi:hypothetical protein
MNANTNFTSITEEQVYTIYATDLENKSTTSANFFNSIKSFEEASTILNSIRNNLSLSTFKILIHADYDKFVESCIPFEKHMLFACYKKYGIDSTNLLLEKYFDSNNDFYTLPAENEKTITHLEHYRNHPETMDIIRGLQ